MDSPSIQAEAQQAPAGIDIAWHLDAIGLVASVHSPAECPFHQLPCISAGK